MTFRTEDELAKQIKTHQRLAYAFLFLLIFVIVALVLSIASLIGKAYAIFFVCAPLFILLVVMMVLIARNWGWKNNLTTIARYYKKEEKESSHYPYEVKLSYEVSFKELKHTLSAIANADECRDFPNKSAYFCFLDMTFKNRFLAVNTDYFVISDFDSIKKSINKAINKEYSVSQWAPRYELAKMMRINLIVTNDVNGELYEYVSRNAGNSLRRTEGVISFAVVRDSLIVPPLFGDNDVLTVKRYKKSIQDMKELLGSAYKYGDR